MWTLTPSDRLRFWSNFRQKINEMSFDSALKETVTLWSYAPIVKNYLTTDDLSNWPDPWQLIYENCYCDLAKALGMLYTLHFCNYRPGMELRIYRDTESKEQYNLVWIENGKYVLNYEFNEIVNKKQLNKSIQLIKTITKTDLNLEKLE
jgi:hypothetical protein